MERSTMKGISHNQFIILARKAFHSYASWERSFIEDPVEVTQLLARLMASVTLHPEIVDGHKVRHNLSKDVIAWLEVIRRATNTYNQEDNE